MLPLPPLLPSDHLASRLSNSSVASTLCLTEKYSPSRVSFALHQPLDQLTPSLQLEGRQWLIQAPANLGVSLQSGLLTLKRRCIYESNPKTLSSTSSLLDGLNSLPPGWWHRFRKSQHHARPLILLSTHNNPNYFHWLTQPGLSPLFLQDYFGLSPLPGMALGLSHRLRGSVPSFLPELLDVFAPGHVLIQGVSLASNSVCRFALQEHASDVVVSPAQLRWLNQRARAFLRPVTTPRRRLFISRKGSNRRRCLNEREIMAELAPYGFEHVCLEDLNVVEQLRLFSESLLIVGAHGAGFCNLLACSSQASIVELLPRPGSFSHYYAMADILGLKHGHLLAGSCDSETDDFTIPPAELIELLNKMELL